jgi:ParB-like nuclease domain
LELANDYASEPGLSRASSIVPLLEGEAFDELVADIRQHGLLEPIVLLDGRILDGRNRYHACQEAGAELKTVDWNGEAGDALDYVVSQNVIRRHLRPRQKGTVAAKIANPKHGGDRGNQYTGGKGSRDPLPNGSDAAEFISMTEAPSA